MTRPARLVADGDAAREGALVTCPITDRDRSFSVCVAEISVCDRRIHAPAQSKLPGFVAHRDRERVRSRADERRVRLILPRTAAEVNAAQVVRRVTEGAAADVPSR